MVSLILFGSLALLLLLNVPIAVSLGLASIFTIVFGGLEIPLTMIPQRLFTALDSFPFMAVPFFMLSGLLMEKGGLSRRLVNFAKSLVGGLPGSLGVITTIAAAFFGAISGSNTATVAAIGGIMIPEMIKEKYPKDYACAVAASAGTLGVVIPPSVPMIVYAVISGVSVGTLFVAGIVPGLLMAIALVATNIVIGKKYNLAGKKVSLKELWKSFIEAIPALLMPVIILGGIYGGIFTPTEAAAVACVYSLIVTMVFYREIKIKDLYGIFIDSGLTSAIVFFVIATSSPFSWFLTAERIPDVVATAILGVSDNPYIILTLITVLLLFLGVFLEMNAIILLMAPLLLPVAAEIGISALILGILMVVNKSVGTLTPPLAVNLLVAAGIGKVSIEDISKKVIPFLVVLMVILFIMTYFHEIIYILPRMLGLRV